MICMLTHLAVTSFRRALILLEKYKFYNVGDILNSSGTNVSLAIILLLTEAWMTTSYNCLVRILAKK